MSLVLVHPETLPRGLEFKTCGKGPALGKMGMVFGRSQTVFLGDYQIHIDDFLQGALYVLTNTDLLEGDARLRFVEVVKKLQIVPGYNVERDLDCKRLG